MKNLVYSTMIPIAKKWWFNLILGLLFISLGFWMFTAMLVSFVFFWLYVLMMKLFHTSMHATILIPSEIKHRKL